MHERLAALPSRQAAEHRRGRRRPRNGQHPLGRRSDGWLRGRPGRRHQPQSTRARAAVAHPVAQSRTPTCDGRWRCRRMSPRAQRSPPPTGYQTRNGAGCDVQEAEADRNEQRHEQDSMRRTSMSRSSVPVDVSGGRARRPRHHPRPRRVVGAGGAREEPARGAAERRTMHGRRQRRAAMQ